MILIFIGLLICFFLMEALAAACGAGDTGPEPLIITIILSILWFLIYNENIVLNF